MNEVNFTAWRHSMVQEIALHAASVRDTIGKKALDDRVMEVMSRVPRHEFVPVELKVYAYVDTPLPIGYGKTISQPFMVALMTDLLELRGDDRVLEIGTGFGYQAAILAELAKEVYSIEIIEELAAEAKGRLGQLGYTNIEARVSDGYQGWAQHAPFDKVIVTAAPDLIPPPLLQQLKSGGRMIIPTGIPDNQHLVLVEKNENGRAKTREILPVRFSPLETDDEF